ncbi:hypothetical protein M9H77_26873 [Catharanthus roseus]|uniref:Uncharacterized protein n=1 Tax=Catharanthus roseus TaxID=4058 RepID=A0ACC0ACH3_CATRO|nr:hypothetical protein M9H77_26873 [Catharanthus roseus]
MKKLKASNGNEDNGMVAYMEEVLRTSLKSLKAKNRLPSCLPFVQLARASVSQSFVIHTTTVDGRSSKWALELSEYHIDFSPRKTVQGQTLANFLVECIFPKNPDDDTKSQDIMHTSMTWIFNVDGSAGT